MHLLSIILRAAPAAKTRTTAVLAGALLLCVAATAQPETLKNKPPRTRRTMPELRYKLDEGGTGNVSDYLGKVVYIAFWSSRVQPAVQDLSRINLLAEKLRGKGVTILLINLDAERSSWRESLRRYEPRGLQVWMPNDSPVLDRLGVMEMPHYVLLDKKGKIYDQNAKGPNNILLTIEDLLNE